MVLELIDILSPRITIYFYGRKRHSSIAGGFLTLLMFIICIIYICYISSELFTHKSPNSQYFRRYMEDAGYFTFDDKGGIFHFFQLYNSSNENFIGNYNKKYVRIIMSRNYDSYQIKSLELSEIDHWVYDECRDKDIPEEYKYLINKNIDIKNNICIRYFYSSDLKKYIPIDDNENFVHPRLTHGVINNKNLFLSTFIEKCQNSSKTSEILGNCAKQEEINKYFDNNDISIDLFFVNHQVNIYNYKKPNNILLSQVTNSLNSIDIPVCNIYFSPLEIRTHTGIIFGYSKEEKSYLFEENRRSSAKNDDDGNGNIISIFYYWLQNNAQIYERKYKNLLDDILPKIGGVVQTAYYLFFFVNKIFNKLKIIKDSMNLIFEWDQKYQNVRTDHAQFSNIVKSLQNIRSSRQLNTSDINQKLSLLKTVFLNQNKRNSYSYKIKNYQENKEENREENKEDRQINKTYLYHTKTYKQEIYADERRKSDYNNYTLAKSKSRNLNNNKEVDRSNVNLMVSSEKIRKIKKNSDLSENDINKNSNINLELSKNNCRPEDKKCITIKSNLIENKNSEKSQVNVSFRDYLEKKNENNRIKERYDYNILKGRDYKQTNISPKAMKEKTFKFPKFIRNLTCWDYICSIFCFFEEKRNAIYILKQFRKKLLSEEHFFRTNILLCLAEKNVKVNGSENVDIVQLYKNL